MPHGNEEGNGNLSDQEEPKQSEREKKPLPENIAEHIQRARDELKQYEEHKKFYEKKRKKEIVLELVYLLEEHNYPKEWLRLLIARELGDYISTNYIEKILAEKYPDERKKVKEQSTRQTTEITQNEDRIPIEVSSTGESIVNNNEDDPGDITPYSHGANGMSTREAPTEFKTDIERQAEEGTREIVRALQKQVRDLQTKCYQLDQLAKERSMWEEKYIHLKQELKNSSSYENKNRIIKGTAQIEFGSEFLPVKIEYNCRTNQFSAWISEGVIKRILGVSRRQG
jgi:hypothetical protein